MKYYRKIVCVLLIAGMMFSIAGCGEGENKKIVLTTGFEKNEVFRIEDISCMKSEIMVYLTNTQNQYEQVYGEEIWETSVGDVTLEENVKDIVLAKIARIKTLNLMAASNPSATSFASSLGLTAGQLGMRFGLLIGALFPLFAILIFAHFWREERKNSLPLQGELKES